jgi:hypothetical protein
MKMDQHPTRTALEAYVIDALSPAEAAEVERHVAACPSCAAALTAEAVLEGQLHELARTRPLRRPRARWVAAVASLAVAASLVIYFRAPRGPRLDFDQIVARASTEDDPTAGELGGTASFDPALSFDPEPGVSP